MTTKLQHSINPLTKAPHSIFPVNPLCINHQNFQEVEGFWHKVQAFMDRMLELHSIESMRNAILMQEEIFKQQVQELHRLYNLQKKLMNELQNGLKRQNQTTARTETTANSEFAVWNQTATEKGHSHSFQAFTVREDPNELSGSCSGESSRIPIKFGLERPAESGQPSNIHQFEEQKRNNSEETDVEVELSLSIGHCTRSKRSKSHFHPHDSGQTAQVGELGSSTNKEPASAISSSSVYQENRRPHWLLQDLSLNRT